MKLKFNYKPYRNSRHVVFECSATTFGNLIKLGRVLLGWESCRAEKFVYVTRCALSYGYGHPKTLCDVIRNPARCPTCASTHGESSAPCTRSPSCYYCIKANKYSKTKAETLHHPLDRSCPKYKTTCAPVESRTNYSIYRERFEHDWNGLKRPFHVMGSPNVIR